MKPYLTLTLIALASSALAAGPLTPPGPPAPTMKSLQEIWDKIGGLETQVAEARGDVSRLQAENQSLALRLISNPAVFSWSTAIVDTVSAQGANPIGAYPSLAFSKQGQPAIAYYQETDGDLKYAISTGTETAPAWTIQTVDTSGDVGKFPSLAFAPDGEPAIAYYDDTNDNLKFAKYNAGTQQWVVSTVESTGGTGYGCSLAYNPAGQPAISYLDANQRVKLAKQDGTPWSFLMITAGSLYTSDSRTALRFTPDGRAAIAYINDGGDGSGESFYPWLAQVLPNNSVSTTIVGGFGATTYDISPSVAIGPNGRISISTGLADGPINLRFTDAGGSSVLLDATAHSGHFSSLAFGLDGQPMIAHEVTNSQLKFTQFAQGAWQTVIVDTAVVVGNFAPSIAIGPDGQPGLAYRSVGKLKIARRSYFKPNP